MSIPIGSEHGTAVRGRERARVLACTGAARLLTYAPPLVIRRALALVSRGARPSSHAEVEVARAVVCGASAGCAGLGCLQRSIAVVLLCRSRGHAPAWRTGFRTEPFVAHAWVEVDGRPVGEPDEVASYRPVLSLAQPVGAAQGHRR